MKKKKSALQLLEEANARFYVERRRFDVTEVMAKKHVAKVKTLVKRYGEPFEDGFQLSDIGSLMAITQELIEHVDGLVKLDGEGKKQLVVSCVMLAYQEYGGKLPFLVRWIPNSWVRSMVSSAVDGLVNYLRKKEVI